ncbi:MAG: RNA polymerase sporulation sigma factor SigK [Peptococcaceae bacterium]|nr:RNA polymerase sporulation sigma factor SigK [Peptococcaceae bacterium]
MFAEIFILTMVVSVFKGVTLLVSYINNNAFPQPLKEGEERDYLMVLAEYRENTHPTEEDRLNTERARNKLVEHNLRLVAHLVKKFEGSGQDIDDLISIGTIGLIKGINTYNAGKGTRLATYAARCIENEVLMYLRSLKKSRSEVSMYEPIGVDKEGNTINLIDILGTDADAISEQVEKEFEQKVVLSKLNLLNPRERMVLQMRFGLFDTPRKTQREIAKLLKISRSYVSRIEKKAIQFLLEEMKG